MTDNENTKETTELDKKVIPQIIQYVNANDIDKVSEILLDGSAKIDDTDDSGMTSLQHACYKGQLEMAKLLLQYGADVNTNSHSHNYSCLHFAALSSNTDMVRAVLSAGAKTYHTNSLKRTAAQMAAFVGNHNIVCLINNFIPKETIQYYTKTQGLETKPKLPVKIASPLHNLVMQSNLHPVFIALSVNKCPVLLIEDHLLASSRVLRLMCEKEVKRAENVNEVLCLKLHYLSCVLNILHAELENGSSNDLYFESIMKKWLIGRRSDGFEVHLDCFLRESIKSFPFIEMPLFLNVCRNIATRNDQIWALDVLSGVINGQARNDVITCTACAAENESAKKCSKCKSVQYCDKTCQRLQWQTHKKFCLEMSKKYIDLQKLKPDEEEEADVLQQKILMESLQGLGKQD